jgi:MFS family permease
VTTDPRELIAKSPMSVMQVLVVAITVALNALDGFDVLSISFASPGIAAEWGIARDQLGYVLAMELFGMALGSIFLGGVADKIGRRPTVLGCLSVMALGMFMVTTTGGLLGGVVAPVLGALLGTAMDVRLVDLSIWRVITGLGIGGMLAAINAVAAEFSNTRRRDLNVAIMSIGYPVGAAVGGFITSASLQLADWRSIFQFGATVTVALIPIVYFLMPESVHWLARKQPAGALEKINRTLRRFGHSPITELPAVPPDVRKRSVGDIFRGSLLPVTVLVTMAYFFHITTFYFIVKWVPKIVVDMGFPPGSAGNVLSWTSVGGATGGTVVGILAQRFGVKGITLGAMLPLFGRTAPNLVQLSLVCAVAGFCTNGAITGMYALFAKAFPTHVRAFGTGFAVGVGRGGSMLAPIIAGYLFTAGYTLPVVAGLMALGSLLAAGVLSMLKLETERPVGASGRSDVQTELKRAPASS